MKVAVIGSRTLTVENLEDFLPNETVELISGGANGIDSCAKKYAEKHNLKITEYLPNYSHFGRAAPIKRNIQILESADFVLAFWDGISKGTKFVISECEKRKIPHKIIFL